MGIDDFLIQLVKYWKYDRLRHYKRLKTFD